MASTSSPPLWVSSHDNERPTVESIQSVVASINEQVCEFLDDRRIWKSAKLKCVSKLMSQKSEFFEFSEHSVLSNFYWGVESIEAAIQSKCQDEKSRRLRNSERMLQAPALLNELGVTAPISNTYLVCCSYFYLSLVRKLRGDDWQVASHFLQAVLVSPRLVRTEFLPKLCHNQLIPEMSPKRGLQLETSMDLGEDEIDEALRTMARRYKAWLTYYQVMSFGENPQRHSGNGSSVVDSADDELQSFRNRKFTGNESSNLGEGGNSLLPYHLYEKVHPIDPQEYINHNTAEEPNLSGFMELKEHTEAVTDFGQARSEEVTRSSNIKCLQDMLIESQSDNSISEDEDEFEVSTDDNETPKEIVTKADNLPLETFNQNRIEPCSTSGLEYTSFPQTPGNLALEEDKERHVSNLFSGSYYRSLSNLKLSFLELRDMDSCTLWNCHVEKVTSRRTLPEHDLRSYNHATPKALKNYQFIKKNNQGKMKRSKQNPYSLTNRSEVCLVPGKVSETKLMEVLEKAISKLCFSEGLGKCDEDYTAEVVKMYEMLSDKRGVKYTLLKDIILDQLLTAISTSKEVGVIRASVSILSTLVSGNKSVLKDIKKNGLKLCDLASALKRKVHEAAILIYLISPPPTEIKTLELLPTLVEVLCTSKCYKGRLASPMPTPPVASLMIIEVLVTAFDYATNNMHLAAINSPQVLSGLLDVPKNNNLEDFTSLASILVRCMRFDGQCRKYISKSTSMAPFISLLRSNQQRPKFVAVEFFHEILCMPRSSATNLLQQIRKEGSINNMHMLLLLIQQSQDSHPEVKLLAANLLLQLDILEDSPGKSTYREEAVEILLKSLTGEENSTTQQLSAFLLSNLGGTYAWTGEPYTVPWLLKKTGLTSQQHRNMIRNFNWLDQSLEESGTDIWCSKTARSLTKTGKPLFHAMEKGLKSNIKKVSRDCLIATASIGCEIARSPNSLRYTAYETLLSAVEQFLHPGLELEERLLACLCIYNYTSGKGMEKIIHFSEGVRESLRRLSNITWMAEEVLRVANYFLPNKWRISCVHTQILEATQNYSGAVTALIYYKGQLCSGYADGSIKIWDIKGQTATLVLDMKEHRKEVTCFSLFEQGDCLLSGSADKTIRIWQMVQRKMECIEVIVMKEPIQRIDAYGPLMFAVTQSHEMKVFDASKTTRDICKGKNVKCVKIVHGKAYVGCMDSSIQEIAITNNHEQVIKAPSKSWRIQRRAINSISVYKDWLYCASSVVEGSSIKEWRTRHKPQMSFVPDKGTNVLAMEVVEDFIYLNCSSSTSTLQIYLRGTQQKVGRLSAGSKITSLLTGNDVILCGTETGVIKGWIPL